MIEQSGQTIAGTSRYISGESFTANSRTRPARAGERTSYRVAFIDLDDTLLGPSKEVSPANRQALERLRAAGVQISVASGRHHRNIAALKGVGPVEWVLSSHGSIVRHEQTGEVLLKMAMDPTLVAEVSRRGQEHGMSLLAYHWDGVYTEQPSQWTELYARNAGWTPKEADFRLLDPHGFQKVLWAEHPERVRSVASALRAEFSGRLNVVETNPELLEFFAPTANKAVGAQVLAEKLGISREQALAFGDGNNDVEILRWAGLSVAMSHGRESARKAARFVSPPGPPESAFARAVDLALQNGPGGN